MSVASFLRSSGVIFASIVSPAFVFAAEWAVGCDEATGLCSTQAVLVSDSGDRAATFGLQIAKDGTQAVVFVTTPLGVALAPGLRLRSGGEEFALSFDVCYPDGCRASAKLPKKDLQTLLKLTEVEVLIFAFGQQTPAALVAPLAGMKESLDGKVVLPPK